MHFLCLSCETKTSLFRQLPKPEITKPDIRFDLVGREKNPNKQEKLQRPICRNVLEDFCCIKFGGFSRRIFLGTFSHKNEEKKSGEKIREKIRRLKNKNPRKIRSAESRPQEKTNKQENAYNKHFKRIIPGLSRDCPGNPPPLFKRFSWECCFCVSLFLPSKKRKTTHKQNSPPPISGTIPRSCLCLLVFSPLSFDLVEVVLSDGALTNHRWPSFFPTHCPVQLGQCSHQ